MIRLQYKNEWGNQFIISSYVDIWTPFSFLYFAVAIAIAIAGAKWVSNPFHDDAVAIAVDAPSSVNTPIGFHTTHSWRKKY